MLEIFGFLILDELFNVFIFANIVLHMILFL